MPGKARGNLFVIFYLNVEMIKGNENGQKNNQAWGENEPTAFALRMRCTNHCATKAAFNRPQWPLRLSTLEHGRSTTVVSISHA